MITIMNLIAMILGYLLLVVVAAVICGELWFWVAHRLFRKERENAWRYERLLSNIYNVDRWCSYDFPQMEDLCAWLLAPSQGKGQEDIAQFRDRMRRKYGEHQTGAA